jgi:hypothetical protein
MTENRASVRHARAGGHPEGGVRMIWKSDDNLVPLQCNGMKLSRHVIASGAKQSLFLLEIASSLTLLAMTVIP